MKKIIIVTILCLLANAIYSQNNKGDNMLSSIKWNENIVQKKIYRSTANSIAAFCFVHDNTIALLNSETQKIIIYSLNSNEIVKSIPLPNSAIDFDYYNGKYQMYEFNHVYVFNENSQVEQEIHFIIPERTPFTLEKFKVINGRNIIKSTI